MSLTQKPLDNFERFAKSLFEGSLERLLGNHLLLPQVVEQLQLAVQNSVGTESIVPNLYNIYLHPADLQLLKAKHPQLATELRTILLTAFEESDQVPAGELTLHLVTEDDVPRGQTRIVATIEPTKTETTHIQYRNPAMVQRQIAALDAFLIVDGHRHVPLDRHLLTLGRSIENDIVIDHASISRRHAQIRWRYGHFILYDTGSQGGMIVDGRPVQEWVFQPGDLVYLSRRVPLIYGEGVENRPRLTPQSVAAGDETMAIPDNGFIQGE